MQENLPTLQNRSHGSWPHTSRSRIGQRRKLSSVILSPDQVTPSPVSGSGERRQNSAQRLPVVRLPFLDHLQFLPQLDHAAVLEHAAEVYAGVNHAIPADHGARIDHGIAADLGSVADDRAEFS